MSFDTLKVAELKKIAEDFAVDVESLKNKNDVIAALSEEGVTWAVYSKTIKKIEEDSEDISEESLPKFDPKKDQPQDTVLVRMTRANFRYDIMGHTFTKEHPFVAMDDKSAQAIFDKEEGFRLATPKEVQEFYN
jgi:pyruvate/2-oxoacid:ferredoxin oxidoreductase alpha subunit